MKCLATKKDKLIDELQLLQKLNIDGVLYALEKMHTQVSNTLYKIRKDPIDRHNANTLVVL